MSLRDKIKQEYASALLQSKEQGSLLPIIQIFERYNETAKLFGIDMAQLLNLNQEQINAIKEFSIKQKNEQTEQGQGIPISDLTESDNKPYDYNYFAKIVVSSLLLILFGSGIYYLANKYKKT